MINRARQKRGKKKRGCRSKWRAGSAFRGGSCAGHGDIQKLVYARRAGAPAGSLAAKGFHFAKGRFGAIYDFRQTGGAVSKLKVLAVGVAFSW